MPICITCSTPVRHLYTTYSKADDRSLGKGVRLTQCPNCKRFADKYVEHDFVVLFIDLVLIKPQVYRHLLFNRLGRPDDKLDPSILRLGTLLVLFDVYITWARIERSNTPSSSSSSPPTSRLSDMPILTQYLFFLTMNVLATLAQHGVIRLLVRAGLGRRDRSGSATHGGSGGGSLSPHPSNFDGNSNTTAAGGGGGDRSPNPFTSPTLPPYSPTPTVTQHSHSSSQSTIHPYNQTTDKQTRYTVGPGHASPSAISTALLVSSCTKLFPILLVIWPTDSSTSSSSSASTSTFSGLNFASRASNYIGWAVLLNNIEALLILLDCGYMVATTLAVAGVVARWLVEGWALSLVGLGTDRENGFGMPFGVESLWRGSTKAG